MTKFMNWRKLTVSLGLIAAATASVAATCFSAQPLNAALSVNSPFGQRFHPIRKIWTCHCGVDFQAQTPIPLTAVDAGTVRSARLIHGGGNTIELMTDRGMVVKYMHASKMIRQMGDRVAAGDLLGYSGNTGEWTTGPHLHFIAMPNGVDPVDPLQFICSSVTMGPNSALPPPPAGVPDANAPVPMPGGVTGINVPPMAAFPSTEDMSIRDLMYAETHKRFMNPQWFQELENPGTVQDQDPLATADPAAAAVYPRIHNLRELNAMMALKSLMKVEKSTYLESIEARRAALMSLDAKNYSEKIEAMTRSTVGKLK